MIKILGRLGLAVVFLSVVLVFNDHTLADTSQTQGFQISGDGTYSYDASRVSFRNGSAELIPDNLEYLSGKTWDEIGTKPLWRISLDDEGNIYGRGRETTEPRRIYVAKLDSDMNPVWTYTDSPGVNYVYHDYGRLFYDRQSGHIYTGGGIKDSTTGQWYWYVLALDTNGNKVWSDIKIMPGIIGTANMSPDTPSYIQFGANAFGTDSFGNLYAAGISGDTVSLINHNAHLRVVKYDSDGNTIWDKMAEKDWTFPAEIDDTTTPKRQISGGGAWHMSVGPDGNIYTTGPGVLLPWPGRGEDYVTTKITSDGDMLWARAFTGPGQAMDRSESVGVDDEGNVHVNGFASISGVKPVSVTYSRDGLTLWSRNAYNTDSTLTSATNGSLLVGIIDYLGMDYISYGYSVAGGLLTSYDSSGTRKIFIKDIVHSSGATGGWTIAGIPGFIYVTSAEDVGDPAVDGLFIYEYTFSQQSEADLTLSDTDEAFEFDRLTSFEDQSSGPGQATYQISNDGQSWYWFDGSKWSGAQNDSTYANDADEINENIARFSDDVGGGDFYFRAFMDSSQYLSLEGISVGYSTGGGSAIDPSTVLTQLPETGQKQTLPFWLFLFVPLLSVI